MTSDTRDPRPSDTRDPRPGTPAAADDPTGFDAAPARYMATGREAIDIIRERLGVPEFAAFCLGNALKYELRAGHKAVATEAELDVLRTELTRNLGLDLDDRGIVVEALQLWAKETTEDRASQDLEKARWYREMADHVLFGSPDPRAYRAKGASATATEGGAA